MKAIDTCVLVRLFVDDPSSEKQVNLARDFAKKEKKIIVPIIVQAEFTWVLKRAYQLTKKQIISALTELSENQAFMLVEPVTFDQSLELYRNNTLGFSDCLVATHSRLNGASKTVTFDKQFSKLKIASLLQ